MSHDQGWYYFGCESGAGHRLLTAPGARRLEYKEEQYFLKLDAKLAPSTTTAQHIAHLSRITIGADREPLTALSFWDYTVDSRTGSNVILFAPGHEINASEVLAGARQRWPHITRRWPKIDFSLIPERDQGLANPAVRVEEHVLRSIRSGIVGGNALKTTAELLRALVEHGVDLSGIPGALKPANLLERAACLEAAETQIDKTLRADQ